MEKTLYPLKFKPIYKTPIWGGSKFKAVFNRDGVPDCCGESWELSGVEGNVSVVSNGFLAGNDLLELLEVYMGDLVGDSVYERFGNEFPLLIKFIDANDKLSVQVHPGDELAYERHNSFGKTEMWYVLDCDKGAKLISGFNCEIDKARYLDAFNSGKLLSVLNEMEVSKGDVFFIPAGRVHGIGKGILIAEIQQTSNITYRIYDYDRVDASGKSRELHVHQAVDAIDYKKYDNYRCDYKPELNKTVQTISCDYFTTNVMTINQPTEKDFPEIDSFIIYMCTEGKCRIEYDDDHSSVSIVKGETVLVPAMIKNLCFFPEDECCLLEAYIK